jgi:Transcription factor WhiB
MTAATREFNRQLLNMSVRGNRPRCSDPVDHQLWTSEDQRDRNLAAAWCSGCEVVQLCGDAAAERDERWGVWGAKDYSRPARTQTASMMT